MCFNPENMFYDLNNPLTPGEREFPLQEFLEVAGGIQSNISWFGHQCRKRVRSYECNCRKRCEDRHDCCIDYLWQEFAFNNKSKVENALSYKKKLFSEAKPHSCLPYFPFEKDINEYYIMIATCSPNATNTTDISKCLNSYTNSWKDQMPVFEINNKNLYKNKFCARCNHVYEYQYDALRLDCDKEPSNSEGSIYTILKHNPNCRTTIRDIYNIELNMLKCRPAYCTLSDATFCKSFKATFKGRDKQNRNVFCEKCLYGVVGHGIVELTCIDDVFGGWFKTITRNEYLTKKIVCRVFEYLNKKGGCQKKICGSSFRIDKRTGKCKQLVCSPHSIINATSKCERISCPMTHELTRTDFKCELRECSNGYIKNLTTLECDHKICRSPGDTNCFTCNHVVGSGEQNCKVMMNIGKSLNLEARKPAQDLVSCVKSLYRSYAVFAVYNSHMISDEIGEELSRADLSYFNLFIQSIFKYIDWTVAFRNKDLLVLKHHMFAIDLSIVDAMSDETKSNKKLQSIVITEDKHTFTDKYGFDLKMMYTFPFNKVCGSVKSILFRSQETCQNKIKTLKAKFDGSTERINFMVVLRNGLQSKQLYYCDRFHLHSSCDREIIAPEFYQFNENNTLLIYKDTDNANIAKAYQIHQYLPTKDGFQICAQSKDGKSTEQNYPRVSKVERAEHYISMIGSVMSLVCYVVIIVAFAVIPILRNKGGLYVLVLVVILLISDLIFVISIRITPKTSLCKWSGIFLYWFLLTVCLWCGVLAIDLVLNFMKAINISYSSEQQLLWKRLILTVFTSLITTTVMVCLNETETYKFNFEKNCWIGDFKMSLIYYFVPVIVGYVLCFGCLCLVLRSIKQKQDASKLILGKRGNEDVVLLKSAIKLFLILGLSEIFGLIQMPGKSEGELIANAVFRIVYNVMRSLRGVFIFIVYIILNKMTLKTIKRSFGKNYRSDTELSKLSRTPVST